MKPVLLKSMVVTLLTPMSLAWAVTRAEAEDVAKPEGACRTIDQGAMRTRRGERMRRGFDRYGYNYEAHYYSGEYCGATHDDVVRCDPHADVEVTMKWNDAWLSNQDCNGDGAPDRHRGSASYLGSGAELINLMHGVYTSQAGRECHWFDSTIYRAPPLGAVLEAGIWKRADGQVLGPAIWGEFYVAEHKVDDVCGEAGLD